jgi:hypothetical protein
MTPRDESWKFVKCPLGRPKKNERYFKLVKYQN